MVDAPPAPAASGPQGRSAWTSSASGARQPRRARQPTNSHPGRTRSTGDEWLTVDEVCAELRIGRRTFERWRTLGVAPRATRPTRNGPLKIKRRWLDEWAEDGAT
jgi:Helix-turn-helix domain